MMMEHVHNEIARFAFETVERVRDSKEFRSLARSFPSMIQVNGLGTAVAFLYSKVNSGNIPYKKMYEMIDQWTKKRFCQETECKESLVERIVGFDTNSYRLYESEVMNLCLWVKRFAEGMIDSDAEGDKQK